MCYHFLPNPFLMIAGKIKLLQLTGTWYYTCLYHVPLQIYPIFQSKRIISTNFNSTSEAFLWKAAYPIEQVNFLKYFANLEQFVDTDHNFLRFHYLSRVLLIELAYMASYTRISTINNVIQFRMLM